ncbi:meso-butanediol dehydrogenase/(S,S)-butanediol dehydrogenase/diacetyl reductase [Stella humosa]|uniref:Meso-butanediol dehydrogenase/(S,S)-butanediol dehydrogenase/diacetyl reductase n=1 Tax=Stella humosa TaxID=94 RepID=A0A3N1MFP0_9PROT|nr:glucose 1-dehydrogenase [Stella humosa]ROQ01490.1 meso-butanediol dehydrogenase/(S,S)-butanediol dehydrogenase/diacetyl reductase [Stella humosa]BBK31868.1 diacetyl reductase [Stella humosa]
MPATLAGRSIIVTGAGRGIGAALARGLAAEGAHLLAADRDEAGARAVADGINADGGRAVPFAVDVVQRDQVRAMVAAAVSAFGRLDVIFNNAGIAQARPFLSITEEDWRQVTDVNALGCLIGMQEAARQMIAQGGGGKIVNTASIAGRRGSPNLAHYSASKFAVVSLTQSGAGALGRHGITVNAICPGIIATDMWTDIEQGHRETGLTSRDNEAFETAAARIALGRTATPQDLVGMACFLASSGSDYVNGQSLVVDGGLVMM